MRKLLLPALILGLVACQEKENPQLKEAAVIHNEAHEIMEQVEPEIKDLDLLQSALTTKKATTKDTAAISAALVAVNQVKAEFKEWEENLVTVPGVEDEHEHHDHKEGEEHHHHYEHKKAPDVAPDQHLAIQKEIKKNIEKIQADLKAAKAQAEALLK